MPRQIVRAYVRPDLRARFQEQFPGTGSVSWLLETAMTEILAITDGQPAITALVRSAIRAAILRERQAQTKKPNDQSPSKPSVRVIPLHPAGADTA